MRWNPDKAKSIREYKTRHGFSFEDCVIAIDNGQILDIIENPSANHERQEMYVSRIEGYVYIVPFVETQEKIFLKTMMPSRKHTKTYLANIKK